MPDVNAELLRLRDRYHKLNGTVQGLGWKLRLLDDQVAELRRRLDALEQEFEDMTKTDEIADAVTSALSAQRKHRFTFWHKLAGLGAGVVLAGPAIHDLWGWFFG